jgi:hypothetical protein
MNDKERLELFARIEKVVEAYEGEVPDLNAVVGMVVVGRLCGWKAQRLVVPGRIWTLAVELFGDPKQFLPARTPLGDHKSVALHVSDRAGEYWDYVKRKLSMPLEKRHRFRA